MILVQTFHSKDIGTFINLVKTLGTEKSPKHRHKNSHNRLFHWNLSYLCGILDNGTASLSPADLFTIRGRREKNVSFKLVLQIKSMGLGPNWYQIGNKTFYIPKVSNFFCRKRISMLTSLKVLSLACKCVFYRREYNAKCN